mgnify:FL=1
MEGIVFLVLLLFLPLMISTLYEYDSCILPSDGERLIVALFAGPNRSCSPFESYLSGWLSPSSPRLFVTISPGGSLSPGADRSICIQVGWYSRRTKDLKYPLMYATRLRLEIHRRLTTSSLAASDSPLFWSRSEFCQPVASATEAL